MHNLKKVKIVVFSPSSHSDKVRDAMKNGGAGIIGNYSDCSFTVKGVGRYKPNPGAKPFLGEVGKLEKIEEEKIEMVCPVEKVEAVLGEVKKVHPYEEPNIEIYPLLDY